jgi:hypothetical protein
LCRQDLEIYSFDPRFRWFQADTTGFSHVVFNFNLPDYTNARDTTGFSHVVLQFQPTNATSNCCLDTTGFSHVVFNFNLPDCDQYMTPLALAKLHVAEASGVMCIGGIAVG